MVVYEEQDNYILDDSNSARLCENCVHKDECQKHKHLKQCVKV